MENDQNIQKKEAGKGLAVASLVIGILAIVFWFAFGWGTILSIILGIIGIVLSSLSRKKGNTGGMKTAGLVLSIIATVIGSVIFLSCVACYGLIFGGAKAAQKELDREIDSLSTMTYSTASSTARTTESANSTTADNSTDSDEISPDLINYLESYENFVDEYCEFMRAYMNNPTDMNLLNQYTDILNTMNEYTAAVDNYNTSDMNEAELAYFMEVTARCSTKMLSIYS